MQNDIIKLLQLQLSDEEYYNKLATAKNEVVTKAEVCWKYRLNLIKLEVLLAQISIGDKKISILEQM